MHNPVQESTKYHFAYRPDIDGLRAIAVIPVILFHAGLEMFKGGFIGVDIFFVISGYLITSILIKEMSNQTFSLKEFYVRRARRILPALTFVILLCIPFACFWMMPKQLTSFFESIAAVFLFSSNIYFWNQSGYFAYSAEEMPLLHTWSLGIEEQYYFLFPPLLYIVLKWKPQRLKEVIISFIIISFIISEYGWRHYPDINFFLPLSRFWELMFGSLLAVLTIRTPLYQHCNNIQNQLLSLLGFILILLGIFQYSKDTPYPSFYTLLPIVGTFLVIGFTEKKTLSFKVLSNKMFVYIGLISYSAYLWHQPLFAFARIYYKSPPEWLFILLSFLTILLAHLTQIFIEAPFRSRDKISSKRIIKLSLVASSLMIIVGLIGHFKQGFPERLSALKLKNYEAISRASSDPDYRFHKGCRYSFFKVNEDIRQKFQQCSKLSPAVFIIGDSHATDFFNSLAPYSKTEHVISISRGGCRIHSEEHYCENHYHELFNFIVNNKKDIRILLYTQKGSHLLKDKKKLPVSQEKVREVQSYLEKIGSAVQAIWIGPHYEPNIDIKNMNLMVSDIDGISASNTVDFSTLDRELKLRNQNEPFKYISQLDIIKFDFKRDFFVEGEYTYADVNHWSKFGEKYFARRLLSDKLILQIFQNNEL